MDETAPRRFRDWSGRGLLVVLMLLLATTLLVPGEIVAKSRHDRARTASRTRDVASEVVGGTVVPQGRYRFLTAIEVELGAGDSITCSGSLITPLHVLTAAHCVEDNGVLFRPEQFTLVIGQAHLTLPPPAANRRAVVAVSPHPAYNPFTLGHDVAVLTLTETVPPDIAQPIALVGVHDTRFDNPGQAAVVAGWGSTSEDGEGSPDLMEAPLTVISDATCAALLPITPATELCASFPSTTTCFGDSGGPLFVPEVGVMAAQHRRQDVPPKQETTAEGKKHHRHRKRDKRHNPRPPSAPPALPAAAHPATQFGLLSAGGIGCPPGDSNVFTQLSAPAIRTFIAGVIGS